MKTLLLLCTFFVVNSLISQQRFGFDLSTRMKDVNASITYHRVTYKNLILSGGFHFGNYGKNFIDRYLAEVPFETLESPYAGRPSTIVESNETYKLHYYANKNYTLGLSVGIGAFKEFGIKHGVRFNLNTKFLFVFGEYKLEYGRGGQESQWRGGIQQHFVVAISPELVHTIRLSGRITFYYGVKSPYYYSLDKGKFNPKYRKDLFNGFEPELTIGITRVFGKC